MADGFLALNLGFALGLFTLGLAGVVTKRSLVRILLGIEVMGKGVTTRATTGESRSPSTTNTLRSRRRASASGRGSGSTS